MDFLNVFKGTHERIPVWFMRQAGRYLPEYRKLRESCPDFIEFCLNPSLVVEATLQPLRRYDLDAAIIFSDILVIPQAVGQKVWFEKNMGPRLQTFQEVESWTWETSLETLGPVYEGITQVRSQLAPTQALIGFAGAPYTLACYMLEGQTSRTFSQAKTYGFQNPSEMSAILENLTAVIIRHLSKQIEAGCQAVQLFDSWALSCPDSYVQEWLIKPMARIVAALKTAYPDVPILAFPKDLGGWIPLYCEGTKVEGISLSSSEPLGTLLPQIPKGVVTQGTLDPYLLVAGGDPMIREVDRILDQTQGRSHIFNLGHGIVPETPPEHVIQVIDRVRQRRL